MTGLCMKLFLMFCCFNALNKTTKIQEKKLKLNVIQKCTDGRTN